MTFDVCKAILTCPVINRIQVIKKHKNMRNITVELIDLTSIKQNSSVTQLNRKVELAAVENILIDVAEKLITASRQLFNYIVKHSKEDLPDNRNRQIAVFQLFLYLRVLIDC